MKILSYIVVFLLGGLVSYCGTEYFKDPCPEYVESKKTDSIKTKIEVKEKEVIKWKSQKEKIVYRTKFDTLATIDTLYVELIKCDSVVKIDSSIIASQDTIISDQKEVISIVEADNGKLKKEVKKQKRKALFTKIGSGIVIVVLILGYI